MNRLNQSTTYKIGDFTMQNENEIVPQTETLSDLAAHPPVRVIGTTSALVPNQETDAKEAIVEKALLVKVADTIQAFHRPIVVSISATENMANSDLIVRSPFRAIIEFIS